VGEGDTGPNTGGMGAYAPAPILSAEIEAQVMEQIVRPTVAQMAKRGTPFEGVLYVGLMIENGQARLVEYNVRLGDPECQALMMRLGAQALDLMLACAQGRLADMQVGWADDHAVTVVMAAQGYPGSYEKGTRWRDAGRGRAGVERHGAGRDLARGAGSGLCNAGRRGLARRVLSQGYWLARPIGFFRNARPQGQRAPRRCPSSRCAGRWPPRGCCQRHRLAKRAARRLPAHARNHRPKAPAPARGRARGHPQIADKSRLGG